MWQDRADRTAELNESPFVAHLIDTPRDPYEGSAEFMKPSEIDEKIDPSELFMPLPADSSQIVAVHASAQGGDFVLEGPPGTGKSQTIRSEEHTSELQSLMRISYAVFCLKKKKINNQI